MKSPAFLKSEDLQLDFFSQIISQWEITFPLWEIDHKHWVEFNHDAARIFSDDCITRVYSYSKPVLFMNDIYELMIELIMLS